MADPIGDNQEDSLRKAVRQFIDAQLQGQKPDIDEFVRQYPEFEDQIRQKVRNLQKIDTLFDSLVQVDEGEFQETANGCELVGHKLGHFEVREIIGSGGMGVVYLARDTRLDRSVAIKSLPPELINNATARTRFMREAKLLASMNHPNIAVIHDIIEQTEGNSYLVLEYIPGQTLAELITEGQFKLQGALTIALQIAEAVSAAHEHDVIHRDLKPGNIKITPEGRVKVLDFGLAKMVSSKTVDQRSTVTQPGRLMGTPAYMSPEQARGKPTDKRSDIWSFGCLLYEMLTGRIPFEGETVSDTLANILQTEPDWQALPQSTPEKVRSLLRRCLEKNPHRRLRDIGDAAIEIRETLSMSAKSVPTKSRKVAMIIGAATIIVLTAIAVRIIPQKQVLPSSKEIRLVVLPFENQDSAEEEYFADGITDEITARLACIHGFAVISRQSAMQYKNSEKSTQQIGRELSVDYILEGTVQRERPSDPNSRVKIRPQLIRAADDTHVWADIYENDMSEVFQLQADVAERVAQALDITLLEPERRTLASRPTENIEAYEYYLRGNEYLRIGRRTELENDLRIAIQMYNKTLDLDPTFALAYAQLSTAHLYIYWWYHDRSEERLAMAKQAVDKALELDPDLPEAHLALGHYYYHGHLDYDRALEQFSIVRESQPNNIELLRFIGYVQRRQGEFEQALTNIKKWSELDPLSVRSIQQVAVTFMFLRNYPEAERYYDRAISLSPDWPKPYNQKASLYLRAEGSTEKARAVLEKAVQNTKLAENTEIVNSLVTLDVFDENYQEALDRLSLKSEDIDSQFSFIPKSLRYARIYGYMNNKELAEKYYDEARSILENKIQQRPKDGRLHSSLGIAYAGLGQKEDAIREGKLGVELLPVTKEAIRGLYRVEALATIYVMAGDFDAAVNQLEDLLSRPGEMSIPLLRLDPAWDPLHDHTRFKKLLESEK
jgi:serine/threonine protein kinase/Flp pilus assembly protein TadD